MKILIIGGAGFIGSHLCEAYSQKHDVTSIDNYISGKKENHIPGVEYIHMDARDILSMKADYNLIFHLGEYSRVEKSLERIDFVLQNNNSPILNILKFAKRSNAKFIYAGSSTKFADNGTNKFKSPYSFSKWQNSELVKFYCDLCSVPYAITYFYNVYGGRENPDGEYATVIAKFLNRHRMNKKLYVTKPGSQTRNFTYIDDTIEALKIIAESGVGDEYGIANPNTYSIDEVAKLISKDIEYVEENPANRMSSEVLTDKITALGWKPLQELSDYIKNNL
jgi:UDP-glucose 4-epimerase